MIWIWMLLQPTSFGASSEPSFDIVSQPKSYYTEVSFDLFSPPKSHYALAVQQATIEKKNLAVWIRSDREEGICEGVDPQTVCVYLKRFPQGEWSDLIQDGDAVYSENRGNWFEVVKILSKSGQVRFQKQPAKSLPTVKQSLKVPTYQQSFQSGDCSTGNCSSSGSSESSRLAGRFSFRRGR